MSNSWNEGYFTDVDYLHGYYQHLNPVYQRFCLLAAGLAPLESNANSAHCELGYGLGTSINAHAIAQPALYVGTDFTPSQAAFARHVVETAGVDARLYDDSFEQLLHRSDMPQFDSISLHGIWTWISAENRDFIIEFARRHLKPGGAFSVSYNAQPGWSTRTPMRHIMRMRDAFAQSFTDLPAPMNEHTLDSANAHERRIGQALDLTRAVLDNSSAWATRSPRAKRMFDGTRTKNRVYLAHEYFNGNWNCMFFADVARELDAAKLSFATSAEPMALWQILHDPKLYARVSEFIKDVPHPILREQVLDFWRFSTFRKDIYQRGTRKILPIEKHVQLFDKTRYIMIAPLNNAIKPLQEKTKEFENFKPAIWQPILEHLASKNYAPKSLLNCASRIEKDAKCTLEDIIHTLQYLIYEAAILPCQDEDAQAAVRERCHRFNRWVLDRNLVDNNDISLTSPVLGGAVGLHRKTDLLLLLAWMQGARTAPALADRLRTHMATKGVAFRNKENGTLITEEKAMRKELNERVEFFLKSSMPIYQALDILNFK